MYALMKALLLSVLLPAATLCQTTSAPLTSPPPPTSPPPTTTIAPPTTAPTPAPVPGTAPIPQWADCNPPTLTSACANVTVPADWTDGTRGVMYVPVRRQWIASGTQPTASIWLLSN